MPKSAIRLHWLPLDPTMQAPLSFFSETDNVVILNRFSQDMILIGVALPIALMFSAEALFGCNCHHWVDRHGVTLHGDDNSGHTHRALLLAKYLSQDKDSKPVVLSRAEVLEGLPTIRAFGWQGASSQLLTAHLDRFQTPHYMLICTQRRLDLVLDMVVMSLATVVEKLAVMLRSSTSHSLLGLFVETKPSESQPGEAAMLPSS
ncbi:ABC transporter integral membrane type 1 [Penicillium nucicola]|uniref:ABC transporter integral membrane type 1 n=1 Tax=Penicillium nucicola TaxID=1850975 RepID=UPI0025456D67|nr:ABC transporter integral membrane type 1 [Penicillium nucicola]KAJ5756881.1 ABC transporter integral membrane type 1 [Penicillium nucicola]